MANVMTLRNPLDELISGFFVRPVNLESRGDELRTAQFRMDVYETENAYRVLAEIPGVKKDDINVTIEGAEITISADAAREQSANENEKALLNERFTGKYYRTFTLAHDVDEANAQARYVDGVLELTLPKSPDSMPKKIAIQ